MRRVVLLARPLVGAVAIVVGLFFHPLASNSAADHARRAGDRLRPLSPADETPLQEEGSGGGSGRDAPVRLGDVWKFKTDPQAIGTRAGNEWFAPGLDDAAWSDLRSGRSWESQGVGYAGYAWYRQRVAVPNRFKGSPLKLTLAAIRSDDDLFFNGVRVGGLKGEYKYKNLLLRTYFVPASLVHAGALNTIAVRLWGGRLGFAGADSGLVAGPYTIESARLGLDARDSGEGPEKEVPIQLYDLSDAQRGRPFELVFRLDPERYDGTAVELEYELKDFYGLRLRAGRAPLKTGTDGLSRAVVPVDEDLSRRLYLAGRFRADATLKDKSTGAVLATESFDADHLSFGARDRLTLPALPKTYESTPYGRLKLIDEIDATTPFKEERHPYLQSGFGVHAQDFMTPGVEADVAVADILGRRAREAHWGWFAYRIGRGTLVPGHTYLLRIAYPEDKPRFSAIEVQAGLDYADIGWKNGVSPSDPYDNWPLSHAWQFYDVIVPLGPETVGTGGAGDADAAHGVWVYFMDQRRPGYYFTSYEGGAAVSAIKLYEIDAAANAPRLNLPPAGLPRRTMTFDWERQPMAPPADIVAYAKLMGYSAVSPTILKWGVANYAKPVAGYTSAGVDAAHYWVSAASFQRKGFPAAPLPGQETSVHEQYLDATRTAGIDYIPRVEYGGSEILPAGARAIGPDGRPARPDRFAKWVADLLDPATFQDFKGYLDAFLKPYAASNPQLKGVLWRIRQDRVQISYARGDIARFVRDTSVPMPPDFLALSPADASAWVSTPDIAPLYTAWWQKKRAEFHENIERLLKSYRPDMRLLYFNWDQDKYSLLEPDRLSSVFFRKIQEVGGPRAYAEDEARRQQWTSADYLSVLQSGHFSGSIPQIRRPSPWPDYAILPSLYAKIAGVQILAPVPGLPYANMPAYLDYFRTMDGLAVSNMVSYDEVGARNINPKYEAAVVLPGGAPFSMSTELLAYFYGDARTLTYTSYTYGRGFADAHRRFAQAFRALPATPGQLIAGSPEDVAARVYPTPDNGTFVGVAYKGYAPRSFSVDVPGRWTKDMTIWNLVTDERRPVELVDQKLRIHLHAGAMELDAFRIE